MKKIIPMILGCTMGIAQAAQPMSSSFPASTHVSPEFMVDPHHEHSLSHNDRIKLVQKGYHILTQIVNREPVEHRLDILRNIDCRVSPQKTMPQHCHQGYQAPTNRRAYLESLIAVLWALSDYAQKTGQAFMNGAYSIIDPDNKLYAFFEGYAVLAGQVAHVSELSYGSFSPINPFSSKFAYNRNPKSPVISGSSHFKTTSITQIGVDARFGLPSDYDKKALALPILPYKKTHFIFGQVTTLAGVPKTFIKNEYHGLSDFSSWTNHAKSYLKSQKSREGKQRSEKDIPAPIAQATMKLAQELKKPHSLDLNYFTQVDRQIMQTLVNLKDEQSLKANNSFDLSGLYVFIKNLMQLLDTSSHQNRRHNLQQNTLLGAAVHVIQEIDNTYHDGIFEGDVKVYYRTGNEVIIDLEELVKKK